MSKKMNIKGVSQQFQVLCTQSKFFQEAIVQRVSTIATQSDVVGLNRYFLGCKLSSQQLWLRWVMIVQLQPAVNHKPDLHIILQSKLSSQSIKAPSSSYGHLDMESPHDEYFSNFSSGNQALNGIGHYSFICQVPWCQEDKVKRHLLVINIDNCNISQILSYVMAHQRCLYAYLFYSSKETSIINLTNPRFR